MSEKLWYLKNCPLLDRLGPDELRRIEIASRARNFPRKSPVYLPADASTSVFLLASGRVKLCHITPDGKQSILAFIEPGEIFGELSMLDDGDREEYAEALENSTVVMIPRDTIQQLMESHAGLTLGITKMIGLRRRRIERRLKNLLFLSNRQRLVHLLLELAEQYGQQTGDGIALGIKLSHQDLANVIGSTRETVTVVLGELQSEDLVAVGRRKITLLKPDQLAAGVDRSAPTIPAEKQPITTPHLTARNAVPADEAH